MKTRNNNMNQKNREIYDVLAVSAKRSNGLIESLCDRVNLDEYASLMRRDGECEIWSDAYLFTPRTLWFLPRSGQK